MICSMFKQVNNWSGEDSAKGRGEVDGLVTRVRSWGVQW